MSADKINLSTFKGEGELTSLELDEAVLTDLLELPSWMRLTSAWCNKVGFRIQWTKLKRVPIFLSLDEVQIQVETCEELRSMSAQQGLSNLGTAAKYNFINKVIDGMTISVNSVSIMFTSPAFTASVQILRIVVESKMPNWQPPRDLRLTKLKEPKKGQILIFKELQWQTVRIEASSTEDKDLPPLRLLTNFTRCRITIKKRLSDCFVMGCRLVLLLDDLLWVLTDTQLKAALHFIDSLSGLIQKNIETIRKKKAARKLEVLPEYQAQLAQQARVKESKDSVISDIFARYDFIETSYHFWCQKIDLHLSDDPGAGRSCHPDLKGGGAFQINLNSFQVDYYPYHLASGDRHHWAKYKESASPHAHWLSQAHAIFRNSLLQLIETTTHHTPLSRGDNQAQEGKGGPTSSPGSNPVKHYILTQLTKLMTSCVILRIEDFTLYRVTTSAKKQLPKEFIKGDKERHSIPSDTTTLHAEFTYYYYPGDTPFPLPPPKFYVHINPVQIHFDVLTLLWLNSFALNLHQSLLSTTNQDTAALMYVDVKVEAIMPRLILESNNEKTGQKDRPRSLHFQVSRASITNVRSVERCSRADLAKCIHSYQLGTLFYGEDFPSQPGDYHVVTDKFVNHVEYKDNVRPPPEQLPSSSSQEAEKQLYRELLWTESKDVWCILLEPVWGDFYGVRAVGNNRPVPFLDAFPLTVWAHFTPQQSPSASTNNTTNNTNSDNNKADIHVLAYVSNLVSVQINHYQFLFLLRLADEATELATFLAMDSNRILNRENSGSVVVGALVPQLEVTFVMPSQNPGKESSGGDLESVIPDSSSLADDVVTSTSIQWNAVISTTIQDSGVYKQSPGNAVPSSPQMSADQLSADMVSPRCAMPESGEIFNISTSVKKGFSSFMTSIDSAFKTNSDDASDTVSLRSDASSDSENYVVVNMAERIGEAADAIFCVGGASSTGRGTMTGNTSGVEVASEVLEEEATITTPSESHSIASSCKRRDLISVATFKLGQVEVLQQSKGFQSAVKVQVSKFSSEECSSIPWDEFQSKFCMRSRGWTELGTDLSGKPHICARLDHKVTPLSPDKWTGAANASTSWFENLLTMKIANSELELTLGTLSGLGDLVEDEIVSQPLPMEITLENIRLHLTEERTPANITSPGPTPIDVSVRQLHVCRGLDGVFHVEPPPPPAPCGTPYTPSESQETVELRAENELLKRKLAAMEKLNEENHFLRRCQEETQILRSCLNAAQDDLSSLLEEKRSLLELIQTLKAQNSSNEAKYQGASKR